MSDFSKFLVISNARKFGTVKRPLIRHYLDSVLPYLIYLISAIKKRTSARVKRDVPRSSLVRSKATPSGRPCARGCPENARKSASLTRRSRRRGAARFLRRRAPSRGEGDRLPFAVNEKSASRSEADGKSPALAKGRNGRARRTPLGRVRDRQAGLVFARVPCTGRPLGTTERTVQRASSLSCRPERDLRRESSRMEKRPRAIRSLSSPTEK